MLPVSRSIPPFAMRLVRRAGLLTLLGALTLTTGCFGLCPFTKSLYKFNKETSENQFVQSVMFWFLSPVYLLGMAGDVIVLNPVEFWSGETLDMGVAKADVPEVPYEVSQETKELLGAASDAPLVMRPVNGVFEIRDEKSGRLAGTIHPSTTGGAVLYGADGKLVKEFPRVS